MLCCLPVSSWLNEPNYFWSFLTQFLDLCLYLLSGLLWILSNLSIHFQKKDHRVGTATKDLQVCHAMGGLYGMPPQLCSRFHVLADPVCQCIALFCMVVLIILCSLCSGYSIIEVQHSQLFHFISLCSWLLLFPRVEITTFPSLIPPYFFQLFQSSLGLGFFVWDIGQREGNTLHNFYSWYFQ